MFSFSDKNFNFHGLLYLDRVAKVTLNNPTVFVRDIPHWRPLAEGGLKHLPQKSVQLIFAMIVSRAVGTIGEFYGEYGIGKSFRSKPRISREKVERSIYMLRLSGGRFVIQAFLYRVTIILKISYLQGQGSTFSCRYDDGEDSW